MRSATLVLGILTLTPCLSCGQDRDTKVRNDRKVFQESKDWIYNDLEEGIRHAKAAGKPLLVIFRCIPCEACQQFDDDVARRDPVIRDLLDAFVCVRIVQANAIDLTRFQHDFDQSFAAYLMNADSTIYGRYGTRSDRSEEQDISLEGFRKAMEGALLMHQTYDKIKATLAGKQAKPVRYKTPREYPSLAGKYGTTLDYDGKVAKSCMHCHQIREAERVAYRSENKPIPDNVLFPNPDPSVLGLFLDSRSMARVERVSPGSIADKDGVRHGDEIVMMDGQQLLSIADVQWVLQNLPNSADVTTLVRRDGKDLPLTLHLSDGWRRGNISWRVSTWDLRRMALGGMKLVNLTEAERERAKLPKGSLGLRVEHVGEFGDHAIAKQAGLRKDDVIVGFDGRNDHIGESELIAHAVQKRLPGDKVSVTILRGGVRQVFHFSLK
ncbi:MAG: serine endoprotease [Planctomycetota bacterium]|nr:serine endoprotease [Planctomycetota bacterium]